MANVTQLKHLEHLEDEMLNYGVEGCKAAVSFLKELRKMLGCDDSTGFMQTKWDGAPAVVCGEHPVTGIFFVGTKSVFNKNDPKICYTEDDVERYYGQGDLSRKLKASLKWFGGLEIQGIIQGDLLFTSDDVKVENVHGERLYTFRPNTITYGIPVDHPIGKEIKNAKIGVVFHTPYGNDWNVSGSSVPIKTFAKLTEVAVVDNDTPMHKVGLNHQEEVKFDGHVATIEKMCGICGDFLDELVTNTGSTGDQKWHIATHLKPFFNAEIKAARTINNADNALESLYNFYYDKTKVMLDRLKTNNTKVAKAALVHGSLNYLETNKLKFKAMLGLYKELQTVKQMVVDKLDHLETFRTFAQTDNGYKVTGPEGYVLHKDGDMIKFVNRLEFSYINFTLAKQWR